MNRLTLYFNNIEGELIPICFFIILSLYFSVSLTDFFLGLLISTFFPLLAVVCTLCTLCSTFLLFNDCFLYRIRFSSMLDMEWHHMSKHLLGAIIQYLLILWQYFYLVYCVMSHQLYQIKFCFIVKYSITYFYLNK